METIEKVVDGSKVKNDIAVVGNERIQKDLVESFNKGTLSHALIISGPMGIGKALIINNFAKHIFGNDENISRRIDNGMFPDLLRIKNEDGSEISIDEVRKIGKFLGLAPAESKYRLVIIDSADYLNINASNALLKLLEEPPRNVYIFLISHSPFKLLPTIRSRCRAVRMKALSNTEAKKIIGHLKDVDQLIELTGGSPGLILEFDKLKAIDCYSDLLGIFEKLDMEKLQKISDQVNGKANSKIWSMVCFIIDHIMNKIVKQAARVTLKTEIVKGEFGRIEQIAKKKTLQEWEELADRIRSLIEETNKTNLDRKQILLIIFNQFLSQ